MIKDFFANEKFKTELKAVGVSIANFVKFGAGFVKVLGEAVMWLGPGGTLAAFVAGKALGWLVDKAMWIENGVLLSQGFMTGNAGGGFLQALTGTLGGPIGMLAKSVGVLAAGVAGWAAGKWIGGKLSEAVGNKSTEEGDTSSMWGAGLGAALALGIGAA